MTTQHTPGPWKAVARTNAFIEIEAPNQPGYAAKKVAAISMPNHEANARLIAAAPELLEAIKRLLPMAENNAFEYGAKPEQDEDIIFARAAIAKATGE